MSVARSDWPIASCLSVCLSVSFIAQLHSVSVEGCLGPTARLAVLENGVRTLAGATDPFSTMGAGVPFPGGIKRPGHEPVLLLEWGYTSLPFLCLLCTQELLHFYHHHHHRHRLRRRRHSYCSYFNFCCFQVDLKKLRSRKRKMPLDWPLLTMGLAMPSSRGSKKGVSLTLFSTFRLELRTMFAEHKLYHDLKGKFRGNVVCSHLKDTEKFLHFFQGEKNVCLVGCKIW